VRIPTLLDQNDDLRGGNASRNDPNQIHAGQILVSIRARYRIVARHAPPFALRLRIIGNAQGIRRLVSESSA
jgi:hypothetical protein